VQSALGAPLQVVQNDFVRRLGGLRRCVPTLVLCTEACLPPLPAAWMRACTAFWNRARNAATKHKHPVLEAALRADVRLAASLPPGEAARTWAGAYSRALRGVVDGDGGDPLMARKVTAWQSDVASALAAPGGGGELPFAPDTDKFFSEAVQRRWEAARAARPAGAHAQYIAHFQPRGDEHDKEPAFPQCMPWYYRHTSRFGNQTHVAALMRSTDLAADPTNHAAGDTACPRCADGDQTAEHTLLDCVGTATLCGLPQFEPLFMGPMPPPEQGRLRVFVHTPHQYLLAKYVHACLAP
jgi:hypothetical protein